MPNSLPVSVPTPFSGMYNAFLSLFQTPSPPAAVTFDDLPDKLRDRVLAHLDYADLLRGLRVSKAWAARIRALKDWQLERRRNGLSPGHWHGAQQPDYTREDFEVDRPADPTLDALVELARCAWLERQLRGPDDGVECSRGRFRGAPDGASPSCFNGEYVLESDGETTGVLRGGHGLSYELAPNWPAHATRSWFLPDRRHFATLVRSGLSAEVTDEAGWTAQEEQRREWLALFRLGHAWPVAKRALDLDLSLDIPLGWSGMHVCGDRLVLLIPGGGAFVYSLPDLQQLKRTDFGPIDKYPLLKMFSCGSDGKEALAMWPHGEQLRVYHLPDLTLQHQLELPGKAQGYGLSDDGSLLAVLRTRDEQLWLHLVHLKVADGAQSTDWIHVQNANADTQTTYSASNSVQLSSGKAGWASAEFRQDLLLCWSSADHTLHVLDLELRPRWRFSVTDQRLGDRCNALFLGADTMIVGGRWVCSWRREPGRLIRKICYSALARLHAANPRLPLFQHPARHSVFCELGL